MVTLFACMSQGENHYSRVSISKIQELLEKFHKIHVKRRWIFYCLADLLENKLITRKSRHVKDHNGLITQVPSLLAFRLKGVAYLVSKYVVGAKKLYKSMVKFGRKDDKRWPDKVFKEDTSYRPATTEERKRLNDLVGIVVKKIE